MLVVVGHTEVDGNHHLRLSILGWKWSYGVYLLAGLMLLACVGLKVLEHYSFWTSDYDTGIYSNVAWNVSNGNGFLSSVLGINHLGEHFSPITAIFAPLMQLCPTAYWLMIAQGLAVGSFLFVLVSLCFTLEGLADEKTRSIIALCLLIAAFMYTPLVGALSPEFHPSSLAMPLIALAILAIHKERNILLCILVLVLLTTKESAILATVGLGLYAWLVCGRRRLALGLFVLAGVSALLVFRVAIPFFRGEEWGHYSRLGFFRHWDAKAYYLLMLCLPLGFLPLLAWRAAVPALVLISLNLSVKYQPQFALGFHYDDMSSVFLLIAAMHGAFRVERWTRDMSKLRRAGLVVILLLLTLFNKGDSLFLNSPLKYVPRFWPTAVVQQLNRELVSIMPQVSSEDGVIAQECLGPRLNFRKRYHMLVDDFDEKPWLRSGDYIFLTPVRRHFFISDFDAYRKRLLANSGVTPIHVSEVLEVYRVQR